MLGQVLGIGLELFIVLHVLHVDSDVGSSLPVLPFVEGFQLFVHFQILALTLQQREYLQFHGGMEFFGVELKLQQGVLLMFYEQLLQVLFQVVLLLRVLQLTQLHDVLESCEFVAHVTPNLDPGQQQESICLFGVGIDGAQSQLVKSLDHVAIVAIEYVSHSYGKLLLHSIRLSDFLECLSSNDLNHSFVYCMGQDLIIVYQVLHLGNCQRSLLVCQSAQD